MSVAKCTGGRGSGFEDRGWEGLVWRAFLATTLYFAVSLGVAAADTVTFADRLAGLAAKCDELGLKEQAELTRGWFIPRYPRRQYLFLPTATDATTPKASATATAKQWHKKFLELRREQAAALFAQAMTASDQRQPARAYQLLYEVLREDPDHAEARRIMGYVKTANRPWALPETDRMIAEQSRTPNERLGWRAGSFYRLETPHFQIISNHSKAEILEAGQQLEKLHALWRQIFFRYWSTSEALAARFASRNEPLAPERPKMQVVLFKTRQEYSAQVAAAHPKAAATLGLYDDKQHIAYFFAGDKSVYPTWYHEATHQLFQEAAAGTSAEPGQKQNFWALEGAALYMESLAEQDGYWTAGGCEADRLQFARYRILSGDLTLPIGQMVALSRNDIQNSDDIGRIYTQAAGIAHFLIDGQEGKHREAFVDLLSAVYRGEDTAETLATLTSTSSPLLDAAYRDFLNVSDDDLVGIPDVNRLRNLSLCRTTVTDQGLARFAQTKNLQWLDLSVTAATDAGLQSFVKNAGLKQLFLEGAMLTAASLPTIAGFKQLEQLDLSRLPISDGDLAALLPLRNLKILFLTGCPLTDASLAHLRSLKQLEQLDTTDTQITSDGLTRLRPALPKLKLASP